MKMISNKSKQKSGMRFVFVIPLLLFMFLINGVLKAALIKNVSNPSPSDPKNENKEIRVTGYANSNVSIRTTDSINQLPTIYYIDGKKKENMNHVNPENIKSIEVKKEENAVYVETKRQVNNSKKNENPILNYASQGDEKALIFVDGKQLPFGTSLDTMNKMDIDNISINKNPEKPYRDMGADMLIRITTTNANKADVVTAVSTVKMNVLYLGVDNPVRIASSGYSPDELKVSITNGVVRGKAGNYVINPRRMGNVILSVYADGKIIQETAFRVKKVPNPEAKLDGRKDGEISKDFILKAGQLDVVLDNFVFDMSFEVVSFTVSTDIKGKNTSISTEGNVINSKQVDLINSLKKNDALRFENIKAKGPDGEIRKLSPMAFLIEE